MSNQIITQTLFLSFLTTIGVILPLDALSHIKFPKECYERFSRASLNNRRVCGKNFSVSSEMQILAQSQNHRVESLFKQAAVKFDQGELKSALKIYEQVLEIYNNQNNKAGEAATLNKIGQIYSELLQDAEALNYFEPALAIYKQIKDETGQAESLTKIGESYYNLNNHSQGLEFLLQARIIQQKGDTKSQENQRLLATEADTLFQLGRVYIFLGKYALAVTAFEKSLEIRFLEKNLFQDSLNQQLKIGSTQLLIGAVYLTQNGNDPRASKYFQLGLTTLEKVLSEYRKAGNKFKQAKILSSIGNSYTLWKKYPQAFKSLQESLKIFQEIDYVIWVADILKSMGRVYAFQGELKQQLYLERQALEIYQEVGDLARIGNSFSDIAGIYSTWFSQHKEALKIYQEALAVYQKLDGFENSDRHNTQENLAETKFQIGTMYFHLGQYQKTLDLYQQALLVYQKLSNPKSATNLEHKQLAETLQKIGDTYLKMGRLAESKQLLEQALIISKDIKELLLESEISLNLSRVALQIGQVEQAQKFMKQSSEINEQILQQSAQNNKDPNNLIAGLLETKTSQLSFARKIGNRALEAIILENIGEDYAKSGEYSQAFNYYQQSLEISKELGNRSNIASNLSQNAILYFQLKKYPQALDYSQESLKIYQEIKAEPEQAALLSFMGEILLKTGNFAEAETELFNAIKIWESLRGGLVDEDKISLFDIRAQPYKLLQKALIAQNKTQTALEISEGGRARAFVDLLISRTSSNLINESKLPSPITIKQIQQIAQQQKATIIEYSLISNQEFYIWIITPTGKIIFRRQTLENNSLNFPQLVTKTRQSLGVRGRGLEVSFVPSPNSQSHLKQLYQLLIEPIADLLPTDPQQKLIFIPQNSLFSVPFPALVDKDGKYLIEKHTILTAPSIQVLQLTHEKRQAVSGTDILIVGNPTMPNITTEIGKPPEQLSSLPGAETEAIKIAQILKTQPLIGSAATKKTIAQQLAKARIIHFATHGLLEYGIPEESEVKDIPGAIALAPSGNDNGLLTSREIFNMKLNAELVVLSACDTGRGDITGDGVIGLSRSLITAGVPSVIVSLWSVPDAPTAELMTEFYQKWKKSGNKAEALREAMLTTMQSHQHPRNWAAFTLIGEAE